VAACALAAMRRAPTNPLVGTPFARKAAADMDGILDFLDLDRFHPSDFLVIATLIVLEGLLSCDNAVALAMLVRKLPKEQQGKALRYGIIGAYTFLFVALCLATWIISQWYLKVLGGCYLLWIAANHFLHPHHNPLEAEAQPRPLRRIPGLTVFWSTVVLVECTDIAFSVDSIAAAVALSDKFYVLLLAGFIYILVMRFAAQGFIYLLRHFPRLETAAFLAVATIGLKLVLEFPGDVVGRMQPLPVTSTYATAQEYIHAVENQRQPVFSLPYVMDVYSDAAGEPDAARFADEQQFRRARSHWNLHGRALLHIGDAASSLLILLIFAAGFLKRAPPDEPPKA
jgi:YkoY family integral membrane protein